MSEQVNRKCPHGNTNLHYFQPSHQPYAIKPHFPNLEILVYLFITSRFLDHVTILFTLLWSTNMGEYSYRLWPWPWPWFNPHPSGCIGPHSESDAILICFELPPPLPPRWSPSLTSPCWLCSSSLYADAHRIEVTSNMLLRRTQYTICYHDNSYASCKSTSRIPDAMVMFIFLLPVVAANGAGKTAHAPVIPLGIRAGPNNVHRVFFLSAWSAFGDSRVIRGYM